MSAIAVFVKYPSTSVERPDEAKQSRLPERRRRRQVVTEGFCIACVAGSGSFCPQDAQFSQERSMGLSHFGHVACIKVPQCGQNGNLAFSTCPQPGQGFGRGSRRMKYKIIPM